MNAALIISLFLLIIVAVILFKGWKNATRNLNTANEDIARLASQKVDVESRNLTLAKDTNTAKMELKKLQETFYQLQAELRQVRESHRSDHDIVSKVKLIRDSQGRFRKMPALSE